MLAKFKLKRIFRKQQWPVLMCISDEKKIIQQKIFNMIGSFRAINLWINSVLNFADQGLQVKTF